MGEDHDYDITGEEEEQDEMDVDEDDYGSSYVYSDEDEDDTNALSQKSYTILKEEDIHQHQEEDITTISTVLSISREAACLLLRRYNWSVTNVHEAWFADEESVRRAVGILKKPLVKSPSFKEAGCGICFETYSCDSLLSAGCSHVFCNACWKAYISTSISDGPGCLALRCPDPSCGAAVGQDMINKLASNEDKEKYHRFLLRSYVEDNHKIKGCPRCDFAVEYVVCNGSYDVTCSCSYTFCWNCTKEAHQPVDCETVAKWVTKEEEKESAILQWIWANSKPCPRCKRLIEKDQGCMHMTCACEFEFCWLCLGAWSDHVERTGGLNACNPYEAVRQEGVYDEAERRREMAKNSSERYTHYYERWASNESSRQKALVRLRQMQSVHLGKLSEVQSQPESQLKFILEAWQQIVECRRVLKWTYAYDYYLPENEHTKRQFLYNLQGDAEAGLERLHQYAEKELMNYLNSDGPSKDFIDFRMKLADRTRVTRNYFENLVRALENGLSDVDSQADDSGNWACDLCTYVNAGSATTCQMCQLPLTYAPRHETEIFRPAFHD